MKRLDQADPVFFCTYARERKLPNLTKVYPLLHRIAADETRMRLYGNNELLAGDQECNRAAEIAAHQDLDLFSGGIVFNFDQAQAVYEFRIGLDEFT
jgi:hypothetical protein